MKTPFSALRSSFLAAAAAAAATASGSGFSLFQGDASGCADASKSIAVGGRVGDMFYNPAVLAGSTAGYAVQAGSFFTRPHLKIEGVDPYTGKKYRTSGKKKWFAIPHAYFAAALSDDVVFGLGLFSRIGLGDEFPAGWFGRYNSTKVDFATYDVSPALAWRATDWLTVGAGLTLQYFDIVLEQDVDAAGVAGLRPYNSPSPSPYDVHQRIHGSDDCAVGWDLGVKLDPVERLHLGLAYHSEVTARAKGHVRYNVPAPIRAAYPGFFGDTRAHGKITEPEYWMAAAVYDLTERLSLGVNVTRSGWSSWDKLEIHEDKAFLPGHDVLGADKKWDDVWRFSAGGSYKLSDEWTAMASFTWDDSPINRKHADYIVPADTREIYAVGLSWERGPWAVDGMYFFENINDCSFGGRPAEGVFSGRYSAGFSHAFAFSVSRQF
ncbi:MAG: outer membrane protein transport protein [Kiritimatiellae bacterium]|nr:outer membrane protein transport protein [Kiritimatiellia bacterium]